MEIKAVSLGFTDCEPEFIEDFNRWYDFDHVPENIALDSIVTARRYVATPELKALRRNVNIPEMKDGQGTFLATYWAGTDNMEQVSKEMGQLFQDLLPLKRIFRQARVVFNDRFRTIGSWCRKDIPQVVPAAIPYLPHKGMMVVISDVPDKSRRQEVESWYDVHVQEVLEVPGAVAFLRFESVEVENRLLSLVMFEDDPKDVLTRMNETQGERAPAPEGLLDRMFMGPYRLITPLHYDFSKG